MRWHRYGSVLYADNEGSRFEITRGSGELSGYYLTERQGLFGEQISLGRFNSLEEAKNAAIKVHQPNPRRRKLNPGRNAVHTSKWDSCVRKVKAKGSAYDPYAVCTAALGERGAIRSSHRRKNANGQFIVAAKIGSKYYFLTPDRMMSSNEATARRYRSFAHARSHAKKLATEIPNASVSVNKP